MTFFTFSTLTFTFQLCWMTARNRITDPPGVKVPGRGWPDVPRPQWHWSPGHWAALRPARRTDRTGSSPSSEPRNLGQSTCISDISTKSSTTKPCYATIMIMRRKYKITSRNREKVKQRAIRAMLQSLKHLNTWFQMLCFSSTKSNILNKQQSWSWGSQKTQHP